ncbi:hypothetical protein BHU62_09355 [Serratia marcescens]|uniref:IprA winged helix-turn-helix domain-containing protein n=1 Tax=Serratia marcescens TaxID=615 RepID=A0A1Q4P127_SERMA|nr:helix-turn-helix domain-containing protein [Serratia marcescens]OKB66837.1 hypothetical protein BHU62_09355 [Serratia marcescens]
MSLMMRPKQALYTLIDALAPYAQEIDEIIAAGVTDGFILRNDKEYANIYLLQAGYVNIRREPDGLVVATAFAPDVIGLAHYPGVEAHFYFELGPHCTLLSVARTKAVAQVNRHDLHREMMQVISFKMAFLYERDRAIQQSNANDIVLSMLKRFALIPREFRDTITVSRFIEQRTTLSRSSIQRVLSRLRQESVITLQEGFLVDTVLPSTRKYSISE